MPPQTEETESSAAGTGAVRTQPSTLQSTTHHAGRLASLLDSLTYHQPTPLQTERIETLRRAQADYARAVMNATNPGREQSEAITCFETSCMWAIKSIVLERS